ncbi:MAG TPA: GDSL-type esterase/lipase family protein, partial [Candidatus Baltobacteraceae bacterium]|nr:GDSL-type esterase/lipase family protein [Candidatus Baltobacteraceae bacterium]
MSAAIALYAGGGAPLQARQHTLESSQTPLRILPLGDSITAGIVAGGRPGSGGYRPLLERLLAAAPRRAILVGSRSDFSPGMSDPWHDGFPGYVIRSTSPGAPGQLYGPLAKQIIQRTRPDIVLLMLGTNDFLRYEATRGTYPVDDMVHSMDLLLGEIFSVDPKVRVIVGAIVDSPKVKACYIERFDTGRSSCDRGVHPSLAGLAAKYAARGYAISYASDLYHAVPRDLKHFPDGIHPSGAGGYDAIARAWFSEIESRGVISASLPKSH